MPTQAAYSLRELRSGDAEDLRRLHSRAVLAGARGAYPPPVVAAWSLLMTAAKARDLIAGADTSLGAVLDGRLAGFALRQGERITALYVDPAAQGRGLGGRLLGALEEAAWDQGLESLSLGASLNARGFYGRRGWREEGLAQRTLPGGLQADQIIMTKARTRARAAPGVGGARAAPAVGGE